LIPKTFWAKKKNTHRQIKSLIYSIKVLWEEREKPAFIKSGFLEKINKKGTQL